MIAAICLPGLGLPGRALAREEPVLAPPVAITLNGKPLDAAFDAKGHLLRDNSSPSMGDFDGNGKIALLVGYHDYTFPPRGKEKDGRPGRLRIYRNLADHGHVRLAGAIDFQGLVPTGRIPQG